MVPHSDLPEGKLALFWILGTISIAFGTWIIGHVENTIGATTFSYYLSIFIGFLLVLFGGLAWIGVAVKVAHHE
jgi:hypothetical protein